MCRNSAAVDEQSVGVFCGDSDVFADEAYRTADESAAFDSTCVGERTCDCALALVSGLEVARRIDITDNAADVVAADILVVLCYAALDCALVGYRKVFD